MPKVTKISQQKTQNRVNVYLDGRFAFGLGLDGLVKSGLKVGREVSPEQIKKLKEKDTEENLFNQALVFLSYRPRSEKEVSDYLKKRKRGSGQDKSFPKDGIVQAVVERLKDGKLVDDRAFVVWWLEQRAAFRPKGRRALLFELRQKGIPTELAEEMVSAGSDELKAAQKLISQKLRNLKNLTDDKLRSKLSAFLARRGFSWDTIKQALEEIPKKE